LFLIKGPQSQNQDLASVEKTLIGLFVILQAK